VEKYRHCNFKKCPLRLFKELLKESVTIAFLKLLGFEFVRALALRNYQVVATSRNEQAFWKNAKEANLDASKIKFVTMDVTNEAQIKEAAKLVSSIGKVALCVNSAGYLNPEKTIRQIDFEEAKKHFMINAIGPMIFAKYFSPLLIPTTKDSTQFPKWINISARTGSIGDNSLGGIVVRV
jgi:NAD(P)-dependent dehydrogenase (short-subunit alcohol dehydrogenase family)